MLSIAIFTDAMAAILKLYLRLSCWLVSLSYKNVLLVFKKTSLRYSFNGTKSELFWAENSTRVERWSSLTRLCCAHVIHGSVVKLRSAQIT